MFILHRQYCARRLRRLYKVLHFTQGTRNSVKPKKVGEDKLNDVRWELFEYKAGQNPQASLEINSYNFSTLQSMFFCAKFSQMKLTFHFFSQTNVWCRVLFRRLCLLTVSVFLPDIFMWFLWMLNVHGVMLWNWSCLPIPSQGRDSTCCDGYARPRNMLKNCRN
jgi:hypothetical protein